MLVTINTTERMISPMSTVPLSTHIEKTVNDALLDVCKRTHRPQSYHAERAIAEYVAREKGLDTMVREGKDAIKRGDYVEHERVVEWLDSWGTDHVFSMPEPLPR